MKTLLTEERRNEIAKILLSEGSIKISQIAEKYSVSTETARKDLIYLEKMGIAKKEHGGALVANELLEISVLEKSKENIELKKAIAKKAVELIEDGSVIMLGSGSTISELAKQLVLKKDIMVITNSVNVAQMLSDSNIKNYIIGGEVRHSSKAVVGYWAEMCLKTIEADIAFVGTSGYKERSGPCVENFAEAKIKQLMIENSKRKYVLADSSKSQKSALVEYVKWGELDGIVSDDHLDKRVKKILEKQLEVIIAETSN